MIAIETLRLHLGLGDDETYDELLTEWERTAVAYVQAVTGRYFGPYDVVTEELSGAKCYATARCRPDRLYLTDIPVSELDYDPEEPIEVLVDYGDPATAVEDFTVRRTTYEAWLERTTPWHAGTLYRVTYVRGYADGAEPETIRSYVIAWVKRQYELRGQTGIASKTMGGYSVTYSREVREDSAADALLAPWIRPVLA